MSKPGYSSNTDPEYGDIPVPDCDAIQHSQKVSTRIESEIKNSNGAISFARYMELALYEPGMGYYVAGSTKFGESGDFITAPEISSIYSRCLARQCKQILDEVGPVAILELGPGTGRMACDILLELESLGCLPEKYLLLETSAELRNRQQKNIKKHLPHLESVVNWLDALPPKGFNGIILANEVLDAMPVHRFIIEKDVCEELQVGFSKNKFIWVRRPLVNQLKLEVEREVDLFEKDLSHGYTSEINISISSWINSLAEFLHQGIILLVDYGYPRREYYHEQRVNGTLLCHYRHRAHFDPFIYPGLQDITSSVNFTRVAEAAIESGLKIGGYTTQAHFLMSCGLEDLIRETECAGDTESMKLTSQIRQLTMPGEMGEKFKVIALCKNFDNQLIGFRFIDHKAKL